MKAYNKILLCTALTAVGAAAAVPAAAQAAETAPAASGYVWELDEEGRIFCHDPDGTLLTGEQLIDGQYYLFAANGVQKTGWRTVNGQRCYFDPASGNPVTGWIDYCGKKYYVDPSAGT